MPPTLAAQCRDLRWPQHHALGMHSCGATRTLGPAEQGMKPRTTIDTRHAFKNALLRLTGGGVLIARQGLTQAMLRVAVSKLMQGPTAAWEMRRRT